MRSQQTVLPLGTCLAVASAILVLASCAGDRDDRLAEMTAEVDKPGERPMAGSAVSSMRTRPYLTTRAHEIFALAHDLADRRGDDDVTPVHITLALVREGQSAAVAALFYLDVPLSDLEHELEARLPPSGTPRTPVARRTWTPTDEQVIEGAMNEARELGTRFYGVEHLLLAFVRDDTSTVAQILAHHSVGYDDVRRIVLGFWNAQPE